MPKTGVLKCRIKKITKFANFYNGGYRISEELPACCAEKSEKKITASS